MQEVINAIIDALSSVWDDPIGDDDM